MSQDDQQSELNQCNGFEWDDYNALKIWRKHHVTPDECEQVLFGCPLIVADDVKHSETEKRYYALGHTASGRLLFVVFTVRESLIRVISARDMHRKEREAYRQA